MGRRAPGLAHPALGLPAARVGTRRLIQALRSALLAAVLALDGGGAWAEAAFDLVFRSGTLDALPEGTELRYSGEGPTAGDGWREVVVSIAPGGVAAMEGTRSDGADAGTLPVGRYDAGVGNPVAMLFLESAVASVADATGGSPFYIRNRFRDALGGPGEVEAVTVPWAGAEVAATMVSLRPFAGDAHQAALGAFADLEVRVVVSTEIPGWYHSLSATVPAGAGDGAGSGFAASLALEGVGP